MKRGTGSILLKIDEPARAAPQAGGGVAVLRLGFRPFYLGGAAYGFLAMLVWLAALRGQGSAGRDTAMSGMIWHVHEMIFGFVAAIVVGFLLTAVRAWTSRPTPTGAPLAGLWLLWAAARVPVWTGPQPLAAIVDCAFLPLVALALLRVLVAAKNRHNIFLPVALVLFGVLNILFHLWAALGRADLALRTGYAATGLIVMFVAIIAGRVVPMFTTNAIPGLTLHRWRVVETVAPFSALVVLAADAYGIAPAILAPLAAATALVHALRIVGWRSWRVGARPILWILHAAYAWLPVGFGLLAGAALGLVPHSVAIHALTVGAIGCAIIAMITRTALGHTGRALVAGPWEIASYWLMLAAALVRVFGPLLAPAATSVWFDVAGGAWLLSLLVYLVRYVPYLSAPRLDGKAG